MPLRKCSHPYRLRYKSEIAYPSERGRAKLLLPSHGDGPRCRVNHNPNDDGPWTTVQIMRVDDDDIEEYSCIMPRYYAVPLVLINKRLAFFEASCDPNGAPLRLEDGGGGGGGGGDGDGNNRLKQRKIREYSYLWRLRTRFLQALFDMNHERRLDENWRYEGIHGFLHRMHRWYGHERCQRIAYWQDEVNAGRLPYATPDISEMDWECHILQDMNSTHIDAFLWNRVSQGYSRVVEDEPPLKSWRAWRRGSRDRKPVRYRTATCSPARELPPSDIGGTLTEQTQIPSVEGEAPAAAPAAAASPSEMTAGQRDEGEDDDHAVGHEGVLTVELAVGPHTQEWALPFSVTGSAQVASQGTSASGPGRLRPIHIMLESDVPEHLKLSAIHCTYSHVEDVGHDFSRHVPPLAVVTLNIPLQNLH